MNMIKKVTPTADFFIEICVQVVNNLSGVYTVIKSKAPEIKKYYGENFYTVGPYYKKSADVEFEELKAPNQITQLLQDLKKEKIICHYGEWLIPGSPKTFLIDPVKSFGRLNKIKKQLRNKYNIDFDKIVKKGRNTEIIKDFEFKLVWGDILTQFIKRLLLLKGFSKKLGVLQFHYSDPSALLAADLMENNCKVGLVATSHSTRLGREIAKNNEDLFSEIKKAKNKPKKISNRRIIRYGGKTLYLHDIESLLTKNVDVLTAVSEVVSSETDYIIGRKPDIITPNGLEMESFPSQEERAVVHLNAKERIYRFLDAYFLPYYSVDIPHSLLFFTSGRYELTTKGYDILFEALGKLNEQLKKEEYKNNIFVFLFIMTQESKQANEEILENMAVYDAIEHTASQEFPHIEKRIISSLVYGHEIRKDIIFDEHFLIESKKLMLKFKRKKASNPPIYAFKGLGTKDPIYQLLLKCGLDNKSDDKIKVIFYPAPVSVADGLLSMDYHEVMAGMHLGIFPSMYEPWGYTPLETAAHSVMSITTEISGFGKFIQKISDQRKKPGIMVLKTENKKREEIVDELKDMMYWVAKLSKRERIGKKLEARKLALSADWREFAKSYIQAHNLAIERCQKRQRKTKKP